MKHISDDSAVFFISTLSQRKEKLVLRSQKLVGLKISCFPVQTVTQPKKLTLTQYRQRASHDLKQQQQQQPVQKLVTSQGTVTGEEVRM